MQEETSADAFQYDYCNIGLSYEVYQDAMNTFEEVFNGFDVPMDARTCPFHPTNLAYIRESQNLHQFKRRKMLSQGRTECPICHKQFAGTDFLGLHFKTAHS